MLDYVTLIELTYFDNDTKVNNLTMLNDFNFD